MQGGSQILPPLYLVQVVEDSIRKKATCWTVPDCGLSSAHRFSVEFEDASKAFVKAATDEETEEWLRNEYLVLSTMQSAFMPYVIAWIENPGIHPILITQDLSHAYWAASHNGVTWRDGDINLLFGAIKEISLHTAPEGLTSLRNRKVSIWSKISGNPEAFLQLNLCSKDWFEKSIEALIDAETDGDRTGNCLIHGDVRSDNVCILGSRVIFVDWSHAAKGYRRHDLATVLPTLHLEGGPAPYLVMPDGGHEAAIGAADHIYRLAVDRGMPQWLKKVLEKFIAIELEWVSKCLNLDEPDGIRWRDI